MYVQVLEKENRVAEAKSNGLGIRVTLLILPFRCVSQKYPYSAKIKK